MNPFRHFALRNASSPFCRLAATSSPGRGKSFHSGGGLGKEGKFRPHSLTAGRNQPITGKLSALAKGSPLGRAGERSEPERVRTGSDPLRQRLLALPPPPRGGRPWQKWQVSSSPSTAERSLPLSCKLHALAKGSPLGRAGERSEPERVRTGSNPLRHRLTAMPPPPKGEALAKTESPVLTS